MWYQGDNKVLDKPKIYLDGSYKCFDTHNKLRR